MHILNPYIYIYIYICFSATEMLRNGQFQFNIVNNLIGAHIIKLTLIKKVLFLVSNVNNFYIFWYYACIIYIILTPNLQCQCFQIKCIEVNSMYNEFALIYGLTAEVERAMAEQEARLKFSLCSYTHILQTASTRGSSFCTTCILNSCVNLMNITSREDLNMFTLGQPGHIHCKKTPSSCSFSATSKTLVANFALRAADAEMRMKFSAVSQIARCPITLTPIWRSFPACRSKPVLTRLVNYNLAKLGQRLPFALSNTEKTSLVAEKLMTGK